MSYPYLGTQSTRMERIVGRIQKTLICAVILGLGLIPIELFFLAKSVLRPEGFWQNFVLYGAGVWFLGGAQILMGALALYLIFEVIDD